MLATALTLVGNASTLTYSLISIVDGKAIRADATAPIGSPRTLTVSHGNRNPKDPKSPLRHLVRLDWTKQNTVTGADEVLSQYVVLEHPLSSTFSDVEIEDMKNQLINFLAGNSGAVFNQFQNSEP